MKATYLFCLLILPTLLFAQDEPAEKSKSFNIGIVPQYAFINGTRLDFDFRLNNKGHWLVVAPQFYINNDGSLNWNWDYNRMSGTGIDLQHRFYFKNHSSPLGPYIAYGPVFQYFSIKEDALAPHHYTENGSAYFELKEQEITTNMFKFGGNLNMGIQMIALDQIYVDCYVGTGFRLSYNNRDKGLSKRFDSWWSSMGYSGSILNLGVRLGLTF